MSFGSTEGVKGDAAMSSTNENKTISRRKFIKSVAAIATSISTPDHFQEAERNSTQTNAKDEPFPSAPPDLESNVPTDFPRFVFPGNDHQAQLINDYLWRFFITRLGNNNVLFNKEYLTLADLWNAGAIYPQRAQPIQEIHREDILSAPPDNEGYVPSHQHFSQAYDHGWPFPLWTQSGTGPDHVKGVTVGWHFQDDGPGWVWGYLKGWKRPEYYGVTATQGWETHNLKSLGIVENKWRLQSTGENPTLTTPAGMSCDAFNSPFLQLRWIRSGEPKNHTDPYVEWLREGDSSFGEDRRVYFTLGSDEWIGTDGSRHSIITMHRHPKWKGVIKRFRLCLAPGESDVVFNIDSLFTVYDTRMSINNPISIFACWNYFRWTGDINFLRTVINRMRSALHYQQTVMGGWKYKHIRNAWTGHDGLPGWIRNKDGSKTIHPGHGIGDNYWDLLPFGWDDMYSTNQYYGATIIMAELEELVTEHPEWEIPVGEATFDYKSLRRHADQVKATANKLFWNGEKGRFNGCVDKSGKSHDYGFTFLNLDAIWYGLASMDHAKDIMDWITGKRIVAGDTSKGKDIYHWRFAPRATTLRNIDWYGQGWTDPEGIPWGGQIQDGGAVLGFSFFDLWARLHVIDAEDAWNRLTQILQWQDEINSAGGYREYYQGGQKGSMQGCGTPGGLGIDCEFFESSLLPSILVYGFMGINPNGWELRINPNLPKTCPQMGVRNLLYHNCKMDILVSEKTVMVVLRHTPVIPIRISLPKGFRLANTQQTDSSYELNDIGTYLFEI